MSDEKKLKTLVFGMMDGNNKRGCPHIEWVDDIVERIRSKSASSELLSIGPKQLAEDGEAGIRCPRAMSKLETERLSTEQ